jgi:HlyD family secretion protein
LAKISLEDARRKYNRDKGLYEKKVISREEYETTEATYDKAREELDAAVDAYKIINEGVSSLNATQSNTLVRATIDGLILDVPVKVGSSVIQANTMNDGTTVATIADMNNLIFKGKVDETEVGYLALDMPMVITIGAVPDVQFDAVIEYISPKGVEENGANSFEIKAAIHNVDAEKIRAGYSANADVILDKAVGVMTIPERVIEFVGDSAFVYCLKDSLPKQVFERKPIVLGVSDGLNVEVKSGIDKNVKIKGDVI